MSKSLVLTCMCIVVLFICLRPAYAQTDTVPDGTEGESIVKIDAPKKPWNELSLGFTTIKFGAGFLYEFGTFEQDQDSKTQSDIGDYRLEPTFKVRDFRLLFSGQLNTKRTLTWKTGFMYDGPSGSWFVRETGLTISAPELWGNLFIGRTKEGYSLNKVMNGYAGWTMERQMAIDVIPILADGIKWLGYLPKEHFLWNAGAYTDWLSEGQSFSTYKWQLAARFAFLPIFSREENTYLHIGTSIRYGDVKDGEIRLRSRPEANTSPYFIDTGVFPSDHSTHLGYEVYYTHGSLMLGSEYYLHNFHSPEMENPQFRGGEAVVSYILTGESRPYSTVSGIYGFVPVAKPVWKGGPGAIEVVLRYSQLNLNSGLVNGGKFWRITPMINWYLSPLVRFEVCYGYGILDRYNLKGATQFFQSRIQFTLL